MTLNETLTAHGYTTAPAMMYQKHILQNGKIIFTGTAHDVWEWLAGRGR